MGDLFADGGGGGSRTRVLNSLSKSISERSPRFNLAFQPPRTGFGRPSRWLPQALAGVPPYGFPLNDARPEVVGLFGGRRYLIIKQRMLVQYWHL